MFGCEEILGVVAGILAVAESLKTLRGATAAWVSEKGYGKRPWLKLQVEGKIVVKGDKFPFPCWILFGCLGGLRLTKATPCRKKKKKKKKLRLDRKQNNKNTKSKRKQTQEEVRK